MPLLPAYNVLRPLNLWCLALLTCSSLLQAQTTRTTPDRNKTHSLVGTYTLVRVNGKPLDQTVWNNQGWQTRFRGGVVTIEASGRFTDVSTFDEERSQGNSTESSGSSHTARGTLKNVGDSLVFSTDDGGRYTMAVRMSVERRILLLQNYDVGVVLTYVKNDPPVDGPSDSVARRPHAPALSATPVEWRVAQSPTLAAGPDRLRAFATSRGADGGSTVNMNALPPTLETEIRRTFPDFKVRDALWSVESVLLLDLDGDKINEAVVISAPMAVDGGDSISVLLGIRQTSAGFEIRELMRGTGFGDEVLMAVRLTASGRSVQRGTTQWARFQDFDCKGDGTNWTVRAGRWIQTKSDCSYGD